VVFALAAEMWAASRRIAIDPMIDDLRSAAA